MRPRAAPRSWARRPAACGRDRRPPGATASRARWPRRPRARPRAAPAACACAARTSRRAGCGRTWASAALEMGDRRFEVGGPHGDRAVGLPLVGERDRVAAAGATQRGAHDGCGAVAADELRPALVVPLVAADLAGVHTGLDVA